MTAMHGPGTGGLAAAALPEIGLETKMAIGRALVGIRLPVPFSDKNPVTVQRIIAKLPGCQRRMLRRCKIIKQEASHG